MSSGPLAGIRVLEFTQIIAGPLGCQLLADLGAEVIKVEPPEGEPWRLNQQFIPKESKTFLGLNRGKRSLAIDVAKPEAQATIHRLVEHVDVVVINYRPDVAARLKIDYETLSAIKPDLVYMDNTASGRAGEWANRPGYDIVVQAASGLMAAVGKVDEKGTPLVPPAFADTTTAYAICSGVLAALFHRARTGEGQKVETSLLINALTTHMSQFMSVPVADAEQRGAFLAMLEEARATGVPYEEMLRRRDEITRVAALGNVYYRCFQTKDGAVAIGALSKGLRDKVRATIGFEHNRDEPDYDPANPAQREIDRATVEEVEAIFKGETTEYWERKLTNGGVPVAPVLFVQELVEHPQIVANGYVVDVEHELAGPMKMQAPPWSMSKTPPAAQGASPPLGRDTDSILEVAGYNAEEIAALRNAGAIL